MVKNVKKKGRVRNLSDSRLWTSPYQREPGKKIKYKIELSASTELSSIADESHSVG